jgi:hypothetical protein
VWADRGFGHRHVRYGHGLEVRWADGGMLAHTIARAPALVRPSWPVMHICSAQAHL